MTCLSFSFQISADGHAQADSLHVELAQQLQKAPLSYLAGLGAGRFRITSTTQSALGRYSPLCFCSIGL